MTSRTDGLRRQVRSTALRLRRRAGRARRWLARRNVAPRELPQKQQPPIARPGRAPDVERETTHLGPAVDDLVYHARKAMRLGVDADYDVVAENFDRARYVSLIPRSGNGQASIWSSIS